ncbi:oligosaccharide flippase family protein [Endozoicomonas sp. G2_2]|uniref:oligosaccharide flippase family protein n=1 Tax=Endozoicomonas sp. G2_2 TaxID=2821092 RepID=UPI001ADC4429|nr:oligosaccharide flippase family protein [Endozoicomonas sp. G2_2]MBO9469077.1 oligosaccharide flippase family protein [Endozoicomonas sp. G2_2]
MLKWLSSSLADALGRILLKVATTVVFAHWLSPMVFGRASLTIVIVSLLAIFVTAPFEESLVQRRLISRVHFSGALAVVLAVSVALMAATGVAAVWITEVCPPGSETVTLAWLVAGFSPILLAHAGVAIFTAMARRHQAFARIAWSNLVGDVTGTIAGLLLVFSGVGVWSLLAVRLVSRFVTLIWLVVDSPVRIAPGWSPGRLGELSDVAGWFFVARCVDKASDAVFQGLVARLFGLEGAGYLNMALRIIEPVRGPTASVSHNIAMSFFVRAQHAPERLRAAVASTVSHTALVLMPVFLGLAVCAPTLIALLGGAKWTAAGPIAAGLALACVIGATTHFLMTALASRGQARLCCLALTWELIWMAVALIALHPLSWPAIGIARIVSACALGGFYLAVARPVLGIDRLSFVRSVVPSLINASIMAVAVFGVGELTLLADSSVLRLIAQVAAGVMVYGGLALAFQRALLYSILDVLRRRKSKASTSVFSAAQDQG